MCGSEMSIYKLILLLPLQLCNQGMDFVLYNRITILALKEKCIHTVLSSLRYQSLGIHQ